MGFKQHEPCPNCGSRNNLARYDDGGAFCFGCHYTEKRTHAPMRTMGTTAEDNSRYHHAIPEDAGQLFPAVVVEWLARFHMDVPTAIKHGLVWSPSREQLIYQLGNCWQARNFRLPATGCQGNGKRTASKNFTSGDVNECLHIYQGRLGEEHGEGTGKLVIVEDPVSAIRVAEASGSPTRAGMPLLGSHLAQARLNAVAGLYGTGQGSEIIFWLDSDKYKEARSMCDRAKYMGLSARTIYTDLDPKCYTNDQLMEILR